MALCAFALSSLLNWLDRRKDLKELCARTSGTCPKCGYDMRGSIMGVCPECSTRTGLGVHQRRRAARLKARYEAYKRRGLPDPPEKY